MNANSYLNEGSRPFYVHFTEEHRRIDQAIEQVNVAVQDEKLRSAVLIDRLVQLRKNLFQHFLEEENGCLDEVVARKPSMAKEAREIEQQHRVLVDRLEDLIEEARCGCSPAELAERFRAFDQAIHEHETQERDLVRRGLAIED